MSKFPSPSFGDDALTDVKPGKPAAAIKLVGGAPVKGDGAVTMLPLSALNTFPDMQPRVTGTAWNERVDAMAADMKAHGFDAAQPIIVFTLSEAAGEGEKPVDVAYIENGHTRAEAARRAGVETVPVIFRPAGWTPQDATRSQIRDNSGEPLSPYEQAMVVSRMHSFGDTEEQIAATLNKTERYVRDLLVLATAPAKLRNSVLRGEIAAREAVKLIRAEGGEAAAEKVEKAVEKAKAAGKKKVTPTALAGKEKQTGKKGKDAKAGKLPESKDAKAAKPTPADAQPDAVKAPEGAPDEAAFLRAALGYVADFGKPAEGVAWAKKFLTGDKKAVEELEKFMGQPTGSYFDPSLRVAAEGEDEDLSDL